MRLECRDAWSALGQRLLAQAGPGGGWHAQPGDAMERIASVAPLRGGIPLGPTPVPFHAPFPGAKPLARTPGPGEMPPLLPLPEAADRARSPKPLPVRAVVAWPGVLVGLAAVHENAWYAEGPLVPLGEGPGTPEPAPGLWALLRAEAARTGLPDQGWTWLSAESSAHARAATALAHGEAAAWRHAERPGRTLRLQRLGPLLCLTEVAMGSDFLLGAFPA